MVMVTRSKVLALAILGGLACKDQPASSQNISRRPVPVESAPVPVNSGSLVPVPVQAPPIAQVRNPHSLFTTLGITPTVVNEFNADGTAHWGRRSGANGSPFDCEFQPDHVVFDNCHLIKTATIVLNIVRKQNMDQAIMKLRCNPHDAPAYKLVHFSPLLEHMANLHTMKLILNFLAIAALSN